LARYVLVHGAFHGAWCWAPLAERLRGRGHDVSAFDLPGAGDDPTPLEQVELESYVQRVVSELEQPGTQPAVLVAHSAGGVPVTQAASLVPERIARLVFVSSFMPGDGQSLFDLAAYPEGADDEVQRNLVVEGEPPIGRLTPEGGVLAFYNTCTPEQQEWASHKMVPQPISTFATPVSFGERGEPGIKRAYVMCLQDQAVRPALQRRMISEHPCDPVIEIDTDHSPFLSATDELVDALDSLAA
jgi:pimeloyl-ACP methyl ester carboxylesterase